MKTINKQAKYKYNLLETVEAGIVLIGGEVKAIKKGKADLSHSFVKIMDNEVYLINTNIPIDGKKDYSPTRIRKLLLHKKELVSIETKIKASKLTLVPVSLYTKNRLVKVKIALAKTKKEFQKKESKKKKDLEREIERELRGDKGNDNRS